MSDKVKRIITSTIIIVLMAALCVIGFLFRKEFSRFKSLMQKEESLNSKEEKDKNAAYWATVEMPEDMKDASSLFDMEEIKQPEGFGVKRPLGMIYEELAEGSNNDSLGVGNIKFDAEVENTRESYYNNMSIKGDFTNEEKKRISESMVKDNGRYKCYVNWSKSKELSEIQYKTLCVVAGKIMEDSLNQNSLIPRYSVIAEMPKVDTLNDIGIPIFYEIDEWGYLSLAIDVTVQDLEEETEIEKIGVYTLYYEDSYLTIKEGAFVE